MYIFKSNKGMAFGLVLMVMAVVSILGFVVLQMSLADTTHAAHENKRMQAYYIARSGVEATTKWMLDPTNSNAPDLVGKTSSQATMSAAGVTGTYIVEVVDKPPTEILVKATGTVDGVSARAALIIHTSGGNNATPVFNGTIAATNNVILSGNTNVNGDVLAVNDIRENGHVTTGVQTCPAIVTSNPVVFPEDPALAADNFDHTGNSTEYLDIASESDQMMVYKEFIKHNGVININTGSAGTIVELVTEELSIKNAQVNLIGQGTLHLFVKQEAVFIADMNPSVVPEPERLLVFLDSGCSATINANYTFNGFIYGPQATVSISGNGGFNGAILAQTVVCTGTPIAGSPADGSGIDLGDLPIRFYSRGPWVRP